MSWQQASEPELSVVECCGSSVAIEWQEPEMKDVIAHILLHCPGLAAQKYYKDVLKDKYFNNEGSLVEPYKTWPRTQ